MYDLNQSLMNHLKTPEILTELSRITRGVEKEGLRVTYEGELSKTNHPKGLGSALTHKYITTDYSEIFLVYVIYYYIKFSLLNILELFHSLNFLQHCTQIYYLLVQLLELHLFLHSHQ